ncbi:MAG: hypothetical protein HS113_13215 [Verrucomicrobiales bacterium]|nr:hypothetical protein [Verrucomicrobiales bacterium]
MIAAIAYGVISIFGGLFGWLQARAYGREAPGGLDLAMGSVIIAVICGLLAFGIFRKSRIAVLLMLGIVIVEQLYTWVGHRSITGTLVSFFVVGYLLLGARRIFRDHRERRAAGNPA